MKDTKILKVMTFNIRSCNCMDGSFDPSQAGRTIAGHAPDVCGIQEIRVKLKPVYMDCPRLIADSAGMDAVFGKALDLGDEALYGIAALARGKWELAEIIQLPHSLHNEPRVAVILKVYHEGGTFYFITTHFSYEDEKHEERLSQMKTILDAVKSKGYFPAVLTGDTNARPHEPCMKLLAQEWQIVNPGMRTFSTENPVEQIDYIAFYPQDAFSVKSVERIDDRRTSDHFPVKAELYFEKAPLNPGTYKS